MRKQRYQHIGKILSQEKASLTDKQIKWMQQTGSYLQKATDGSDAICVVLFVDPADADMVEGIKNTLAGPRYHVVQFNTPGE